MPTVTGKQQQSNKQWRRERSDATPCLRNPPLANFLYSHCHRSWTQTPDLLARLGPCARWLAWATVTRGAKRLLVAGIVLPHVAPPLTLNSSLFITSSTIFQQPSTPPTTITTTDTIDLPYPTLPYLPSFHRQVSHPLDTWTSCADDGAIARTAVSLVTFRLGPTWSCEWTPTLFSFLALPTLGLHPPPRCIILPFFLSFLPI